jgi:predicted nuclease with TOPRIM domain
MSDLNEVIDRVKNEFKKLQENNEKLTEELDELKRKFNEVNDKNFELQCTISKICRKNKKLMEQITATHQMADSIDTIITGDID